MITTLVVPYSKKLFLYSDKSYRIILQPELRKWMVRHIGKRYSTCEHMEIYKKGWYCYTLELGYFEESYTFYFHSAEAALLFKLTWGGL